MTKTDARDIALLVLGVIVFTLMLTALHMHNWTGDCEAGGGTVTHDKVMGIPVESTCNY